MARCKFCNGEISWIKEGRRNRAIDGDGGIHACEQMQNSMKSMKSLEKNDIDPELLKQYESAINLKVSTKK